MIVSHKHKLIFTHIPKNAGTSIRQWFLDNVPDAELQKGFSHWLEMDYPMADRTAKWYDYRWCPQSVWTNERTHVLNHETLETDFRWVQERVGVDAPLETLNSTTTNNDHSTMKNRLLLAKHRPLILSHLLVDFQRFGYAPNFDRTKG